MTATLPALVARDIDLARGYAERRLPLVEAALARSVAGLGVALPGVAEALHASVGIRGGGGRRWRPLLTLAAAETWWGTPEAALPVAAAVELTHTASLVLDDLPCMDDSTERRGQPATHRRIGTGPAILVAVGLLGRAAQLLGQAPRSRRELMADWGATIGLAGMSGGQLADLVEREGGRLTGAIRRLHREKTTALTAFALAAGGRVAGAPAAAVLALSRFGRDLGWAYQLTDDARDAVEDSRDRPATRQAERLRERGERALAAASGARADRLGVILAFGRMIVPPGAPADVGS